MSRTTLWWCVALVGMAIAAVAAMRPSRTGLEQTRATPELPVSVTVDVVQPRDLAVLVNASGRVEAKTSVSVTSRVDSQVVDVEFAEGQAVRRGQLLLRMDSTALEAQQRQAQGVVARDQAQLARLRGDFERNTSLAAQGFISAGGLSQSEADLKATQATLAADQAALDDARLQVGFTRIVAPIDGVAGALQLPRGGAAKANTTPLVVVNQVDPIYVTFSLPETTLAPLKLALARGAVPVSASVAGLATPILGQVAFIDNAVDVTTGAIVVKALFRNPAGLVTPGQFAQVEVRLGQLMGALSVPAAAVDNGVDGPYVFVANADSSVAIRQVDVGPEAGGYRPVRSGVNKGERVVTSGQARLHNQARVTIQAVPARAASAQ